ncbi:hypothetical protein [Ammoniphilus resinae]|uniref:Uncharacterized protein n=1 Tax=Ammoniphilus resinae TaxID=861532 RepID=A0ABS4GNI4_9BACL|nr:hypothetical protein [Ammoniphilus resinae]MBP1931806.1 hypothetical protein [Ammoniphilus resinae]
MDYDLHKKYEEVSLPVDLRILFADLIMADEATRKTFLTIGKNTLNTDSFGITIKQIADTVKINRKVQNRDGTFNTVHTNIDRKHVERIVDKLLAMSICYYRSIPPSKVINLTTRGKEVTAEIKKRIEETKNKGDEQNVVHE